MIVVGGGPGGLAAAARLRERGPGSLEVVILAPRRRAAFLAGALDVVLGTAAPEAFVAEIALSGVRCLDAEAEAVGADGVRAGGEWWPADAVIAAPGLALDVVPAWSRVGVAWDLDGAAALDSSMRDLAAGRILLAVCSLPYRCPAAPYALAVALSGLHMRARHMTRVTVATPEAIPLAGVGGEAPVLMMEACAAAGVEIERGFAPELGRSRDGLLAGAGGRELRYDAAFLIPPHRRALCLAGLPGEGELVAVGERGAVGDSLLYVIGDAAGTGLPRTAGVARGQGMIAADDVLSRLGLAERPERDLPLQATCFMFHHGGAVSRLRVTFEDGRPVVAIDGPSHDLLPAREGERRRFLAAAGAPEKLTQRSAGPSPGGGRSAGPSRGSGR
ncbi:MAG: pyridine nucleotide-disulfide oxidoreductase [Solirubrobacteraceae bacterium]